jgi:hypothetical protein
MNKTFLRAIALLRTFEKANPLTTRFIDISLAIAALAFVIWLIPTPKPVVTQVAPNNTTIQVPASQLEPKTVVLYVEDKENAENLLAENKRLKVRVTQLTEALAQSKSSGGGNVAGVPVDKVPEILRPSHPASPTLFDFQDWRLHFVTDGQTAKYDLSQKFEVLTSTGRNEQGVPVSLVKLFEIDASGKRLPITITKTTSVFADDTRSKWRVGATLIAGLAYTTDGNPGAVVGMRWLTRGRTQSAEDSSLSLLSPALLLNASTREFGLLPVSGNLGRLKYQPFKDLWVSPYVGFNASSRAVGHLGIVVTASF